LGVEDREIRERLGLPFDAGPSEDKPIRADGLSVLCTTLLGAKGLSAEHVFLVGVNEGHFPRDNAKVTDEEICQLVVALTRTRKSCHVVSVGRLGDAQLQPSVFAHWLRPFSVTRTVDARYWEVRNAQS
jgi:superfamily I DNA/RNA helicase